MSNNANASGHNINSMLKLNNYVLENIYHDKEIHKKQYMINVEVYDSYMSKEFY